MIGLPYLLGGGAILLLVTNLATGWKAYEFGANSEKVACNVRVNALQAEYEKQVTANKELNDAWTEAITKVLESGNAEATKLQEEITTLNKKVEDYVATLKDNPACKLDQSDIDSLR